MKKLMVVVGTRPNFVKVTRFKEVARRFADMAVELVHTGQHTDDRMSRVFLEQFGLEPDHFLGIPSSSPAARIGHIMVALEPLVRSVCPTAMIVVGDVDSTLAAALTANKTGTTLVHLESGLRSGDMGMPEEVNRIITDRIAQHCLVTEPSGRDNLLQEGKPRESIHFVGNTMIDTLVGYEERISTSPVLKELGLFDGGHVLMTIHRPANVDQFGPLQRLIDLIALVAADQCVVFPLHPRTSASLERFGLMHRLRSMKGLVLCAPQDYFAFQKLVATSAMVVTDSGGVQEETTFRGIPCLTLRPSTERPITVTQGTNQLITFEPATLLAAIAQVRSGTYKQGKIPELWDGHATERVFEILNRVL